MQEQPVNIHPRCFAYLGSAYRKSYSLNSSLTPALCQESIAWSTGDDIVAHVVLVLKAFARVFLAPCRASNPLHALHAASTKRTTHAVSRFVQNKTAADCHHQDAEKLCKTRTFTHMHARTLYLSLSLSLSFSLSLSLCLSLCLSLSLTLSLPLSQPLLCEIGQRHFLSWAATCSALGLSAPAQY